MTYIDPVQVAPNNYKVLEENDHVRVLEMNLPAGQKDEMHSHPSETVYSVSLMVVSSRSIFKAERPWRPRYPMGT